MSSDPAVRLFAVGDIFFDRANKENPYRDMLPLMQAADVRFCNLEAPVSGPRTPLPGRPYPLCSPPDNLDMVVDGKFDAIAIAHNHLLDFGVPGLQETLAHLTAAQQPFTGAGETLAEAMQPVIVTHDGVRLGFIAVACAFPPESGASATKPGIAGVRIDTSYEPIPVLAPEHPGIPPRIVTRANQQDLAGLIAAVKALSGEVDHVITSFHWGVPGQKPVLDYQREIAHAVIDAGATLVLGHHAHVLQGVERYGEGLIYYGLSHVIFDMPGIVSGQLSFDSETAAAEIGFSRDGITEAWLYPLMMEEGESARTPTPDETARIVTLLTDLSKPLDTALEFDPARGAIRIAI